MMAVRRLRAPMAKASYHHGNLREALIRVAVDQIEEGGVDGFSLARVCRTVGVTHAAAYKHFADRTALLHAVSDVAMREFGRALMAAMAERGDDAFGRAVARAIRPRRDAGGPARVGLCWHVTGEGDRALVWHNGSTGGYHVFFGFRPATKTGVVVLSNRQRAGRLTTDSVAHAVLKQLESAPR